MISSFKSRRAARSANKIKKGSKDVGPVVELTLPEHFRCPISLDLMKDPVTLSTGITYDRESVEKWIFEDGKRTCPVTGVALTSLDPVPNHTIRRMIQDWCVENKSYGIERIPTPRALTSSYQVSEILSKIVKAREKGDREGVVELVGRIKALVKESERNKRCIIGNGSGKVLSDTFEVSENGVVLEEILSVLTMMSPFDQETKSSLGSTRSLRSMVSVLRIGGLSGRRNAVLALKEVLSSDQRKVQDFLEIEGGIEALVKLIKEPICPTTTNASLLAIYHIVNISSISLDQKKQLVTRFLDMGLMEKLLEILVDCQRSVCEKALGVLEGLCGFEEGVEKACKNALFVPVLVKKLLRVSDIATEFSVSILWRLSKHDHEEGGHVVVEALEVGAFQKLLLLLQVGSSEKTKEKAGELLKVLNLHRGRVECIESMDFKNLKRPF